MKHVWNGLKQSMARENDTLEESLQFLLFGILDWVQGALLIVGAGSEGVDVMKLAAAIAGLPSDSNGTTDATSSPNA